MIPKRTKFLILTGFIILIAGISFLVLTSLRTDPTPPEVRAGWYLPEQDIVWTTSGSGTNRSSHEQLIQTGWRNGPAPQFPELSPYCRYENYTQQDTGRKYMIAVWYFNEEHRFLTSEKELEDFLITSGKITTVELNFTGFPVNGDLSNSPRQNSPDNDRLPASLMTTGYESMNTTGLFFTVEIPGPGIQAGERQVTGNDEYYIVYYGTTDPADLLSRTPFLREFIGNTYAYDRGSSAGSLFTGS
jgi:hypothetical protein